ncbi:MAG TPA: hypothetical protein VMS21_01205, partial [Methylomirabilota bacterium]|nr:hypothetical protein [Methylomirabilota bacterium]
MKKKLFPFLVVLLVVSSVIAAELVITSFDRSGQLAWTNGVSNATYRVEWAGSADGPWNTFDALTNLTALTAASNSVTVNVPTFYRVIWTDAPSYAGSYEYRGYDLEGTLAVTGKLSLWGTNGSIRGTRELYAVGDYTDDDLGPQLGVGSVTGGIGEPRMVLNLKPEWVDNNVFLHGWLLGNKYLGKWSWDGVRATLVQGSFTAVKQNAAEDPPSPEPSGIWEYRAWDWLDNLVITGELSFATSTLPVTGNWSFNKTFPTTSTSHPFGEGSFTNGVVSGNTLTIDIIAATDDFFGLEGEMSGDMYAGFWERSGSEGGEKGTFLARRNGEEEETEARSNS